MDGILPALSFDVTGDALERRTYDFFRMKTVPFMAGYFRDDLWDRLILQASHSEPAVRYALNALAATHEETLLRDKAASKTMVSSKAIGTNFPLKQYTKALAELQKYLSSGDVPVNVVLICTILLINYEALREQFRATTVHAEHALSVLHANASGRKEHVDHNVIQALKRIDTQGWMYLGWRASGEPFLLHEAYSPTPTKFSNLVEARDTVSIWTGRIWQFIRTIAEGYTFQRVGDVPLEVLAAAQRLSAVCERLEDLLLDLMHTPNAAFSLRENNGLNLLRARVKVDNIIAQCCMYSEATIHDRHLDTFEEIVMLCNYVLSCDKSESRLLCVSFDEGLLQPLWFVATHCREGRVRHKALKLLEKLTQEGDYWHAVYMTRIARISIQFEEGSLEDTGFRCEDIPEWRRLHGAGLFWSDDMATRSTSILRLRTRPNGMDGEWHDTDQAMEWSTAASADTMRDLCGLASSLTINMIEPAPVWP